MARRKEDGTLARAVKGGWDPSRMTAEGQKTKVKTGGNSRCDRDWIAEIGDDIIPLPLDGKGKPIKPDDCPWDVEFQFQGHVDEVGPEFFDYYRRGTRQCTGVAYIRDDRGGYIIDLEGIRLIRPCLAVPMNGMQVCQKHGGQLGHVREAAQRRLTHAAEKAANALIVLTDTRDEEGELVEQGVRVKAANSVLDRVGIKGGSELDVTVTPGYQKVLEKMFGEGDEDNG